MFVERITQRRRDSEKDAAERDVRMRVQMFFFSHREHKGHKRWVEVRLDECWWKGSRRGVETQSDGGNDDGKIVRGIYYEREWE
jgi:hypothetical protein